MRTRTGQIIASLASSALLALSAGCTGELVPTDPGSGGGGGGGPDAGGGTGNAQAQAYYESNVAPLMGIDRPKGTCVSCHRGDGAGTPKGPLFLGQQAGQGYETLSSNTRLVTDDPATSILITRGDHTGDAWCEGAGTPYAACTEDEVTIVTEWMALEAQ